MALEVVWHMMKRSCTGCADSCKLWLWVEAGLSLHWMLFQLQILESYGFEWKLRKEWKN